MNKFRRAGKALKLLLSEGRGTLNWANLIMPTCTAFFIFLFFCDVRFPIWINLKIKSSIQWSQLLRAVSLGDFTLNSSSCEYRNNHFTCLQVKIGNSIALRTTKKCKFSALLSSIIQTQDERPIRAWDCFAWQSNHRVSGKNKSSDSTYYTHCKYWQPECNCSIVNGCNSCNF